MLDKAISGGQSGADIAGLRAARAAGIPTGGWVPRGWLIEGPGGQGNVAAPELAEFGLVECPEGVSAGQRYAIRRRWNVRDSDGTLLFFKEWTPGTKGIFRDLIALERPNCVVAARPMELVELCPARDQESAFGWVVDHRNPAGVVEWIRAKEIRVLNVAGPRASKAPKIKAFAERFLGEVFAILKGAAAAASNDADRG